MNNIFSENITWSIGIIVILFGILAAHRLILYREKRNEFFAEAAKFRSKIFAVLEGIYPISQSWWDETTFPRFGQSIAKIETISAEFRHFVKRKSEFNNAVKEYREYCQKRIYERASAWSMYPNMHTPDDIGPAETFKNIVEHLFSFANGK